MIILVYHDRKFFVNNEDLGVENATPIKKF